MTKPPLAPLSWTKIANSGPDVSVWAIASNDSGTILAVGTGDIVLRSTNGGATWTVIDVRAQLSMTLENSGQSNIVYAGNAWVFNSASTNASFGGFFRSVDDGLTWESVSKPDTGTGRIGHLWYGNKRVLAITDTSSASYILVSTNNGGTWKILVAHSGPDSDPLIFPTQPAKIFYRDAWYVWLTAGLGDELMLRSLQQGAPGSWTDVTGLFTISRAVGVGNGLAFGNGVFLGASRNNTSKIPRSFDGMVWEDFAPTFDPADGDPGLAYAIHFAANTFVTSGNQANHNSVYYSVDDGDTWTRTLAAADGAGGFLRALTYDTANNKWVVIGAPATGDTFPQIWVATGETPAGWVDPSPPGPPGGSGGGTDPEPGSIDDPDGIGGGPVIPVVAANLDNSFVSAYDPATQLGFWGYAPELADPEDRRSNILVMNFKKNRFSLIQDYNMFLTAIVFSRLRNNFHLFSIGGQDTFMLRLTNDETYTGIVRTKIISLIPSSGPEEDPGSDLLRLGHKTSHIEAIRPVFSGRWRGDLPKVRILVRSSYDMLMRENVEVTVLDPLDPTTPFELDENGWYHIEKSGQWWEFVMEVPPIGKQMLRDFLGFQVRPRPGGE